MFWFVYTHGLHKNLIKLYVSRRHENGRYWRNMDSNLVSRLCYYIILDIFICCFGLDDTLIIDEKFLLCGLNVCWNLD